MSGAEAAASIIQPLHICIDFIHRGLDVTVDRLQIINGVLNHLNRICGLFCQFSQTLFLFLQQVQCLLLCLLESHTLAVIKAAKIAEISKSCNAIIVAGIDLELTQGAVHFNLSIEDQANIANLFRVVELGGTEFPYQSDGGVCRLYTATEIAQIYIAAQTLITTQTTYHNALKAYVQSLDGAEEISAVTYGMTLPEPYLSEMNAKLAVAQAQMNAIMAKLGN